MSIKACEKFCKRPWLPFTDMDWKVIHSHKHTFFFHVFIQIYIFLVLKSHCRTLYQIHQAELKHLFYSCNCSKTCAILCAQARVFDELYCEQSMKMLTKCSHIWDVHMLALRPSPFFWLSAAKNTLFCV